MKFLILVVSTLFLMGCTSQPAPMTDHVHKAQTEQGQTASAALHAGKEVGRLNPEQNRHTNVVEREIELAISNLPKPTEDQLNRANSRAFTALEAENEALVKLYTEAAGEAQALQERLDRALAEREAQRAAQEARNTTLQSQVRWLTWFGGGLVITGVGLGFFGNPRLGIMSGAAGGSLILLGRAIAIIPDWAFTAAFVTSGVLALGMVLSMFWGYRTGLFQHPPKQVGEYGVSDK